MFKDRLVDAVQDGFEVYINKALVFLDMESTGGVDPNTLNKQQITELVKRTFMYDADNGLISTQKEQEQLQGKEDGYEAYYPNLIEEWHPVQ